MTIKILQDQLTFEFAVNTPNILEQVCDFKVFSLYSNTDLLNLSATLLESNARFSIFRCDVPQDFWNNHYNGMYQYTLYFGSTIYDTGSFKLVTRPGGDTGTQPYISNNENRQAEVIYRPQY